MIKAVLFDLDGTLIDTNELIIKCFKYIYKEHLNLEVSTEEICKHFGEPLIETFRRHDEKNAESLTEYYKKYNSEIHDDMAKGFGGARETILALKELGLKVGVVTSKRKEMTDRGLKIVGIDDLMDVIVTPEDTKLHKPNPEPILFACDILGVYPKNVLYVGDSSYDIRSSKAAGAKACLVKYTVLSLEELMLLSPNYMVDSLFDIVDIIKDENDEKIS